MTWVIVKSMLNKILTVSAAVGLIGVVAIMTITNPSEAGPAGILLLFVCMYIVVLSATTWMIFYGSRLIKTFTSRGKGAKPVPMSLRRSYYYGTVLALGPVLFIGMQSINGIGVYEFGLIVVLVALGCVYVARKMPSL